MTRGKEVVGGGEEKMGGGEADKGDERTGEGGGGFDGDDSG